MWYETMFPKILNMSITASIVILIVLLARVLFRKAPRIVSYSLWAVVLFRLLCPITLSANFSALNLFDVPVTEDYTIEYIPNDIVSSAFPKVDFLVDDASDAVNAALPQGDKQIEESPLSHPVTILTMVWSVGTAALLLHSLRSLRNLRKQLSDAQLLRENIYISQRLGTPIVMGLLCPKIYLPAGLTRLEQDHVLLHEDYHIRRGDHVIKLLSFAALCIHWFNPLVWVAFYLSDKDMEMSCDEAVVKDMTMQMRCDYSASLLRLSTGRRIVSAGPLSFCEGDPKGRIQNILSWKNPQLISWVTSICICALLAVSLLTDPVFATEAAQPFCGRLHLVLPEGYNYTLLDDPSFYGTDANIIVYKESSEHPISDGCISIDFTPTYSNLTDKVYDVTTLKLGNGIQTQRYTREDGSLAQVYYETENLGTIQIRCHNTQNCTEEENANLKYIVDNIIITGPVAYSTCDLSEEEHLTVKASDLSGYSFWSDNGSLSFDFSDARGDVTVQLYETYTNKFVSSFTSTDAARDDHYTFTGLTKRKEYYMVVIGNENATITIFN